MFLFDGGGNKKAGSNESGEDPESGGNDGEVQMTEKDSGAYTLANEEDVIGSEVDHEPPSGKSNGSSGQRLSMTNLLAIMPHSSKLSLNVSGKYSIYISLYLPISFSNVLLFPIDADS